MFPHVDCDQVRDIFEGVNCNQHEAMQTLTAIYGDRPEDLSDQFRVIDEAGNDEALVFDKEEIKL